MPTDLDLIIFDCDGVLVDSEPIALRVNADLIAELGWHITDDEIIDRFVGRSMAENVTQIEAHLHRPVPADWTTRFAERIAAEHDAHLRPVDGIIEALDALAETGIPLCVASSGSHPKIEHSLALVGLLDRFTGAIFSATDVARGKPAPDLFLHAAAAMGAQPARCAVVEDSRYGVQAARAAGMRVLAYGGGVTAPARLDGPHTAVFTDMRKLPALL
jgi:HAD superfamily hydrolase (TIGR01509 family)